MSLQGGLKLPVALDRGDTIYVETKYAQDALPHYGVMGFSVLMIHRTQCMIMHTCRSMYD